MELSSGGIEDPKFPPVTSKWPKRKLSTPVTFLSPPIVNEQAAFRRRFSNVGDAVSRKLSTTIGWRPYAGPPEEVVAVGRALCTMYMRARLKKAGLFDKKLNLIRVRSALGSFTTYGTIVREVFVGLQAACAELERANPKVYTNVSRRTGRTNASGVLLAVGKYTLDSNPTWGKVVSLYSVAGALAVDCVRLGNHEQLPRILEDMTEVLEDKVAEWIYSNGGWYGLLAHCTPTDPEIPFKKYMTIFGLVATILLVVYFVVGFFVKMGE